MSSKCIMVQGTSSSAGKSVLVAALCRIFSKRGYRVAPFKSQNMSLNSFTTHENREIAVAQVLQAEAAGIRPSYHMNPILLKPKEDFTSQVIVHGRPAGNMNFQEYQTEFRETALKAIKESLDYLKERYDIIVIEGAGSPAEINMRDRDLANMEIAHLADADVILVADIDRGGVFASIAGTLMLLDERDRSRIKGVVINKFRGNLEILMPGIERIEEITGVPVLGVLPYDENLKLPEEDSASLSERKYRGRGDVKIGVMRLPRISNFTDIDPLEYEEDVAVRLIESGDSLEGLDAIIIPGTRNTISDLMYLRENGFADEIRDLSREIPVFGICGGFQMLGRRIVDENLQESKLGSLDGLNLLDCKTTFTGDGKIISRSEGEITGAGLFSGIAGETVEGYELHEGTTVLGDVKPLMKVKRGFGNTYTMGFDGAADGNVAGTYFHGIFHNFKFRRYFTNLLRERKGLEKLDYVDDHFDASRRFSIDRLAEIVEENMDLSIIEDIIEGD
ncbi:cobyric acid synthase CobQ [Methanothermobacter sp.]|uniref:cobyric acid synthase CobQ n=1 Tax=Methanothermobacter sp. TaxID=1884223 RepID=UPI002634361A|nr:cobyric acid synthase CobQ [Methanothermobacter sp.]MDI9618268.1 cobyric acid synthase CobQ [Methanothermobacter sp.]